MASSKYRDPKDCQMFLAGLCPHDVLNFLGPCPNDHRVDLQKEYRKDRDLGIINLDEDLINGLDDVIVAREMKIGRTFIDVGKEAVKAATAILVSKATESMAVSLFTVRINMMVEIQSKRDNKDNAVLEQIENLKDERAKKQSELLLKACEKHGASLQGDQSLLCDVCGEIIKNRFNEQDLRDHFKGELHIGYAAICEKLKFLRRN